VNVTGNVFVYGSNDEKSDLGGHDNRHAGNLLLFVGAGFGIGPVVPGHADHFVNNTVVLLQDGDYGHGQDCGTDAGTRTVVSNNRIYSPKGNVEECGTSLDAWQKKDPQNNDPGTTAAPYPSDIATSAVQWAADLLGLQ
jgi:hypothetical protein